MKFIEENWNSNHILARDREFFDWMYVDSDGCNFVIALDEDGTICGIEGVIKYNNSEQPDIAGTMWKVKKTDNPRLGMDIGSKMYEIYHPRGDIGVGLTKRAAKLNLMLGYLSEKLSHYYILGEKNEYKVAKVMQKKTRHQSLKNQKRFVTITSEAMIKGVIDDNRQRQKMPYKDCEYIIHRYWNHPIYHYDIIGIKDGENEIRSLIVGRAVSYNDELIYKIIDYIGVVDDLHETASCFYDFIDEKGFEYIDLYCYGIPKEIIASMGFWERNDEDVIIPNYFSPFERRNVDIYFSSSMNGELSVFRGDGDQDRPS